MRHQGSPAPDFLSKGARTKLLFMAHSEDEIDHFIFFEPEVVAYTLKICFSLCSNINSFFPLKQGFKPALLGFQPLVYGHDNPVSAAAAHSECHQLLSFPTLLESREEMIDRKSTRLNSSH